MFVRTKRGADRLVLQLQKEGVRALAIHGDLRQTSREKALDDFSKGRLPVLVATDVAARGLDIEDVDVVIHYDPPEDHKAYVHRSGRTARAGDSGVVATLLLWDQVTEIERIQKRLGLAVAHRRGVLERSAPGGPRFVASRRGSSLTHLRRLLRLRASHRNLTTDCVRHDLLVA